MSISEELLDQGIDNPIAVKPIEKPKGPLLINDNSIYYKGFFGMILCILPGAIIGLILIKISLDQSKSALEEYRKSPETYKLSSYTRVKRGRVFAFIGLVMFLLEITAIILFTGF